MYWLVLHGALVWQAALAVLLLAGGLLGVQRSRRRIRREASAARAGLGEPRRRVGDARDGAEVTLAGTLRASGPCASFLDGAEAAATSAGPEGSPPAIDARAEQLELVLEDGAVRVEGPVSVMVGARELWLMAPLAVLPPRVLERAGLMRDAWVSTRPAVFRAMGTGDAVVARGLLRRSVGGEGRAGYRDSASAWCLAPIVPPQEHLGPGSVVLAAERAPRVGGPVGGPVLAGATVGLAIFTAVFVGLAATLDLRNDPVDRIALGAATPLRRAEALDGYREQLERQGAQEKLAPEALDRLVEVELSAGRCAMAARVLLDHGQWARAADFGERCERTDISALAAFELGDFARVVRLLDAAATVREHSPAEMQADKLAVRVHLLSGNLERAEVTARDILGAAVQGGWADQDDVRALACVADALAARRGDRAARERLRAPTEPKCQVLADDLDLDDRRAPRVVKNVAPEGYWPERETFQYLQEMLAGGVFPANRLYGSLDPRDALLEPASHALFAALAKARLEALAREPEPEPRSDAEYARHTLAAYLLAVQARFALATGDRKEAVRLADRAAGEAVDAQEAPSRMDVERDAVRVAAGVDFDPGPWQAWLAGPHPSEQKGRPPPIVSEHTVAALLALRPTPEPERGVFPRDEDRLGPVAGLFVAGLFDVTSEADERVMFDAARGMSVDLAGLLWRQGSASERTLRLVALTNRSAGGRDELLRWARWGRVTRCIGCDVATTFSDVTAHLALAEAFGDEALAAELRPVVERFRAPLSRRETAVPLAIFESLPLERRLPGDPAK